MDLSRIRIDLDGVQKLAQALENNTVTKTILLSI